ncbi:MAG: sodium:proton antiporter [Gemmataceae bacterium]|nr:sodium:proton antiporter [Gemmataceae bacterium]
MDTFITGFRIAFVAAEPGALPLPFWTVIPFIGLLLSIALMPVFAEKFWHSNLRKLAFSLLWSIPVLAWFGWLHFQQHGHALERIRHSLIEYVEFMTLLTALYAIAGGIVIRGDVNASPTSNALVLLFGAALANLVGTTGASMLLIRPFLRMNRLRTRRIHLPVFFIFLVSNLGGLLTPLGDPPLFLGFLKGVDFFWTLRLWPIWATAVGIVLVVFWIWDTLAFRGEAPTEPTERELFSIRGNINFLLLAGVIAVVLMQAESIAGPYAIPRPWGSVAALAGLTLASVLLTPRSLRKDNDFTWDAIIEVAVLFLGIFITMTPALDLLSANRESLGIMQPWQYFWLTGILSSFLDNAPTYLVFATIAAGGEAAIPALQTGVPMALTAISAGAVLMGAITYIGNGPNFMAKAIAEGMGYPTPSFFGYMKYSLVILIPTFVVVTLLFFRPA